MQIADREVQQLQCYPSLSVLSQERESTLQYTGSQQKAYLYVNSLSDEKNIILGALPLTGRIIKE